MEFFDTVKNRHSIRDYLDVPVEKEKVKKILEAANSAPSAQNLQRYEIFLIDERYKIAELEEVAAQDFVSKAPVVLVFCSHMKTVPGTKNKHKPVRTPVEDATIAAAYAQLAATAQGLGSVWVATFDPDKMLKLLGASGDLLPIVVMPIGYPGAGPEPTSRRKLDDIVHRVI
jgi:nitroreductase